MNRTYIILLSIAAAALASCQADNNAPQVLGGDARLSAVDSATYLDGISSLSTVSEAEALEGVLLVLAESDKATFAQAITALQERKIVPAKWGFQADRPITKGKVAYMTYQACRIKGGLTLQLTGPSQRYCLKELQYRGIMSPGVSYNAVSGMEFLAILGRIDEFRQTGKIAGASSREGGQE
ncbi:MAG: hypothetical protein SVV80_11715 [Planctomycetota bacterium]|nr:hypothetical protein [Planctomycetota bacterium]